MGIRITCPSCRTSSSIDDGLRGKKIRCTRCQEIIAVPPNSRTAPAEDAVQTSRGGGRRSRDEDATPERSSKTGISTRNKEEGRRQPLRGREEDQKPIKKKQGRGPSPAFLIGLAVEALLLLGVMVGGAVFAFRPSTKPEPAPVAAVIDPTPVHDVPPAPAPVKPPEKKEPPKPLPAVLGADDLKRVKQSTVYLRVDLPNGSVSQGTGFFAVERGVIVTNAHVLGMLTPNSLPPKNVTVVLHSGEPGEVKLTGQVLGVDRTNDLAVLRTDEAGAALPAPLQVDTATKLFETQKVFVFGFPLGAQLGKNITVTESSVTSLRLNEAGVLHQVQVNGGMHPGNSGGPVTDSRGVVVGVSVAIIRGTQISFAIPADNVTQVLGGRVSDHDFGTPYTSAGRTHVPVRLKTLDPLQRIRQVKVDVWTGPAGTALPASVKEPQVKPGDGARQRIAATVRDGGYTAELPLPALPVGHVYWAQPVVVNAAGATQWGPGRTVAFDPTLVLDRRPALLQFKAPQSPIERTIHLNCNYTVSIFRGQDSFSETMKMDSDALETLQPDPSKKGTSVLLTLARPRFTQETRGRNEPIPPQLTNLLARFTPGFLVAADNRAKVRLTPNFGSVPSLYRKSVEGLFDTVCNTWEATTLPLPNRMVQPHESWPAKIPTIVTLGGKKEVRFLHVSCIYEGVRTVEGRTQGYVRLTGVVKGAGKRASEVLGKVAGHGLVDVDSGSLAQVKMTLSFEVDTGDAGMRILVTDANTVDRVEGNTRGIKSRSKPPDVKSPPPPVSPSPPPGPVVDNKTPPPGWKEFKGGYKNEAYAVWMPTNGKTENSFNSIVSRSFGQVKVYRTVCERRDGSVFAAGQIILAPKLLKGPSKGRQLFFRDMFLDEVKGKVVEEKKVKLGTMSGLEYLVQTPTGMARFRLLGTGIQVFRVTVIGTKAQLQSRDVDVFFDSFRRKPATKEPPPESKPAKPEAGKAELAKLTGKWKMTRMEGDGRDDPNPERKGLLIDGTDYYFLFNGTKRGGPSKISIDPATTPKSFNLVSGRGTQLGIYQFTEDGELQICLNQARGPGSDKRPTKFTTKPAVGAGSILYVLKKEKE